MPDTELDMQMVAAYPSEFLYQSWVKQMENLDMKISQSNISMVEAGWKQVQLHDAVTSSILDLLSIQLVESTREVVLHAR